MRKAKILLGNGWRNEEFVIRLFLQLKRVTALSHRSDFYLPFYTQYSTGFKKHDSSIEQNVNFVGNNVKSMHTSVEASLKKLRTSYIDLLYVHWWDYETSVEEIMNGLHNLVVQGKVLYLVCRFPCLFDISNNFPGYFWYSRLDSF
jgi:Aldo/keto reductase family